MKITLFITCLLLSNGIFSQVLEIGNSKASKQIKSTDHIILELIPEGKYDDIPNCSFLEMTGRFIDSTKDSLLFNTSYFQHYKCYECEDCSINTSYINSGNKKMIAKSDVLNMTRYKSLKSKKAKNTMVIIGGVIMMGGALTAINALIIGGDNKDKYIIAGGAQLTAGLIIGLSFNQPSYEFMKKDDPWQFK